MRRWVKILDNREIEQVELLKQAKQGNQEATEKLYKSFSKLIGYIAKDYFLVRGERDDLMQEARIGFLDAIRDYDFNRGKKFKNFAYICIKRELNSAIKKSNRYKNKVLNEALSFYDCQNSSSNEGKVRMDLIKDSGPGPEDIVIGKEFYMHIFDIVEKYLSDFEKNILKKRLAGFSYSDIENKVGTNIKSVDNAMQRIRKKILIHKDEY